MGLTACPGRAPRRVLGWLDLLADAHGILVALGLALGFLASRGRVVELMKGQNRFLRLKRMVHVHALLVLAASWNFFCDRGADVDGSSSVSGLAVLSLL